MSTSLEADQAPISVNKPNDNYSSHNEASNSSPDILYKLEDIPPWYLSIILALQHYLTMFSGAIAVPFLISSKLCMEEESLAKGYLISSTLFVCGIATLLQTTLGCKLPIIQGPSLSFLIPTLAILGLPKWQCPSPELYLNMTMEEKDEIWMARMREVQGAIILGSSIEFVVGLSGLMGFLIKWITPLSIAPTITLIGLTLFKTAALEASGHWGISITTIILLIVFSHYLSNVKVPRCGWNKDKGCHFKWFPFFKLFPVMLTIIITWGLCSILTATDVLKEDSKARTDHGITALKEISWFRVPYPGQWGWPTFHIGPVLGIIAGVVASAVESIGDYYACARLSGGPAPPVHALNRGIAIEGFGCILAGLFGIGSGLTSFSQNIGAIGITKVGSRRVVQYSAIIIIISGLVNKFGMLFITIPTPIMGGVFCIMFAVITGVGLANLQYVNLNSSRNVFIIGFSLFMGLSIPTYLEEHPGIIKTGSEIIDQIFEILLKTSMFVGGFLGCLLDNTIPASEEERGITRWRAETLSEETDLERVAYSYNLPCGMNIIKKIKCFKYVPVCPTYTLKSFNFNLDWFTRKGKKNSTKKCYNLAQSVERTTII